MANPTTDSITIVGGENLLIERLFSGGTIVGVSYGFMILSAERHAVAAAWLWLSICCRSVWMFVRLLTHPVRSEEAATAHTKSPGQ